jgi:hypothetical protein
VVRHIVFWKLKDFAEGNDKMKNAEIIKTRLENLNGKIEGLLKAEVNFNYNPDGYDVCLYSELSSKEALDFYQTHPLHVEVKDFVGKVVTDRAVTDCEI